MKRIALAALAIALMSCSTVSTVRTRSDHTLQLIADMPALSCPDPQMVRGCEMGISIGMSTQCESMEDCERRARHREEDRAIAIDEIERRLRSHNVCAPMMPSVNHACPYKGAMFPVCCSTNQTQEQCEEGARRFVAEAPAGKGCR